MAKVKRESPTVVIFEDSLVVGMLQAFGCSIVPKVGLHGRVYFEVTGDVQAKLADIYSNKNVGAMDALSAIKHCRSALFNLKQARP